MELVPCRKKRVPSPTASNSSIFLLLKGVVRTPDMQHHLVLFWIYKHVESSASHSTGLFGSTIYSLSKIIQWIYPEIPFSKYFALFEALHIEKKLLIGNGHLVARTGLDKILGDTSIDTVGLQTATVDANPIHKARYSVQLSVVSIYTYFKKAHEAINSVLLLFSWAKERSSSNHMFKYWMLIMNFQINYIVFIREAVLKFLSKFRYHWYNGFSFSIFTIMLDGNPSHALDSIKNLKEEILLSRFQVESLINLLWPSSGTKQQHN